MRLIRSSFCVFLVFVLLFGLFSTSSYATETETEFRLPVEYVDVLPEPSVPGIYVLNTKKGSQNTYALTPDDESMLDDGSLYLMQYTYNDSSGAMTNIHSTGTPYLKGGYLTHTTPTLVSKGWKGNVYNGLNFTFRDYIAFHANGATVFKKNTTIELKVSGFVNYLCQSNLSNPVYSSSIVPTATYITLQDVSGNLIEVEHEEFTLTKLDDKHYSASVKIPAVDFDVYRVSIVYDYSSKAYTTPSNTNYYHKAIGFDDMEISVSLEEYDESIGLLQGIIEWLRSIRDGIVNVGTFIKELPANIWSKISDGLRALFIPSEEAMIQIRDDWDTLMADRFGAIYEAGSLVDEFTDNFTEQTAKDTIAFPEATVNLAGTDFTFGGWDVDLIPDQFEFLVDILKGVLDVICTLAFINAMKNRFSKVLGGDNA